MSSSLELQVQPLPRAKREEKTFDLMVAAGNRMVNAYEGWARSSASIAASVAEADRERTQVVKEIALAAVQGVSQNQQLVSQEVGKVVQNLTEAFKEESESRRLHEMAATVSLLEAIGNMPPEAAVAYAKNGAKRIQEELKAERQRRVTERQWIQAQEKERARRTKLEHMKEVLDRVYNASVEKERDCKIKAVFLGAFAGMLAYGMTKNYWLSALAFGGVSWAVDSVKVWLNGDEQVKRRCVEIYQTATEKMLENPKLTLRVAIGRKEHLKDLPEEEELAFEAILRHVEQPARFFKG